MASPRRWSAMAVCTMASGRRSKSAAGVAGGGHPERAPEPGEVAGVATDLVRVGDPQAHELEVGAGVDAGDGVDADVARAPGDDPVGARLTARRLAPDRSAVDVHRSGSPRSMLASSMPPSTSRILPVTNDPAWSDR